MVTSDDTDQVTERYVEKMDGAGGAGREQPVAAPARPGGLASTSDRFESNVVDSERSEVVIT